MIDFAPIPSPLRVFMTPRWSEGFSPLGQSIQGPSDQRLKPSLQRIGLPLTLLRSQLPALNYGLPFG